MTRSARPVLAWAPAVSAPLAAILFIAAGRVDLPLYWAYVGVVAAVSVASLYLVSDDLVRERLRPGGRLPGWGLWLATLVGLAHCVLAGLDRGRLHWSDQVPLALRLAALVVFAAGLALQVWAMHVNPFFSSAVRLQPDRGQHVVDRGPYRIVRHPGYAAGIPAVLASGLVLCSWLATALGALGAAWLVWRTVIEDRMLRAGLPGYDGYAGRVRWRLLPGLW